MKDVTQGKAIGNIFFKKHKVWRIVFITSALSIIYTVFASNMPNSPELIRQLGIQQQDLVKLNQGDIVFFDVESSGERELTTGAALYLPAQPEKVINFIKKEDLVSQDNAVNGAGSIPLEATEEALKSFGFKAKSDDAEDFLAATPGTQFNLSPQEFQVLRAANAKEPDAASKVYRNFLWQRWQSYRKKGLKGIAVYDRGDGEEASPGRELQIASLESKVLTHYFPELFKAWLNYPDRLPVGVEEAFFWSNREVQGKATAILNHRVIFTENAGELILARQFYVGRSFNSNQLIIACLPYRKGTLVFYSNRTFTDQVAGFGSGLKHLIGDSQARSEISNLLENLRNALK